MQAGELLGDRVLLRPLEPDDATRLAELGSDPEVARWWPGVTKELVYELATGSGDVRAFAVELEGKLVGLAQVAEELDPEYRHAGIDLFLGTAWQGQGLGSDTVRTLALHLVRDRGHHRITIDPAAGNERAIRCYERVGFKRVGTMRKYERGPDGTWRDGLLMDLLAEELD